MKTAKICLVIGLATVLASSASAISLDWYHGQPIEFKIITWDMNVVYTSTGLAGVNNVNTLGQRVYDGAGASQNVYYDTFGNVCDVNDANREDGWGVFKVTSIVNPVTGATLWRDGQDGEEITGIYYGQIDNAVYGTVDGAYLVQSQNITYDLYVNAVGTFETAVTNGKIGASQGSAARTGYNTYNGITDGTLLLRGNSLTSGLKPLPGTSAADAQFYSTFRPNATYTSGTGDYQTRIRLTDGIWKDTFYTGYSGGDMELGGHSYINGDEYGPLVGNWTYRSQDPLRPITPPVIPEPLTMMGVGIGLMGLGGYIRRRMS
jgi:hypothetical protein